MEKELSKKDKEYKRIEKDLKVARVKLGDEAQTKTQQDSQLQKLEDEMKEVKEALEAERKMRDTIEKSKKGLDAMVRLYHAVLFYLLTYNH